MSSDVLSQLSHLEVSEVEARCHHARRPATIRQLAGIADCHAPPGTRACNSWPEAAVRSDQMCRVIDMEQHGTAALPEPETSPAPGATPTVRWPARDRGSPWQGLVGPATPRAPRSAASGRSPGSSRPRDGGRAPTTRPGRSPHRDEYRERRPLGFGLECDWLVLEMVAAARIVLDGGAVAESACGEYPSDVGSRAEGGAK